MNEHAVRWVGVLGRHVDTCVHFCKNTHCFQSISCAKVDIFVSQKKAKSPSKCRLNCISNNLVSHHWQYTSNKFFGAVQKYRVLLKALSAVWCTRPTKRGSLTLTEYCLAGQLHGVGCVTACFPTNFTCRLFPTFRSITAYRLWFWKRRGRPEV